ISRRSRRWMTTRWSGWRGRSAKQRNNARRNPPDTAAGARLCRVGIMLPARANSPPFHHWILPVMNLHHLLAARAAAGKPVRVALIGAGKFGSMFLSQVPHTPGLQVPLIADIDPERAREACRTVGWDIERIAATSFVADGMAAIKNDDVE